MPGKCGRKICIRLLETQNYGLGVGCFSVIIRADCSRELVLAGFHVIVSVGFNLPIIDFWLPPLVK